MASIYSYTTGEHLNARSGSLIETEKVQRAMRRGDRISHYDRVEMMADEKWGWQRNFATTDGLFPMLWAKGLRDGVKFTLCWFRLNSFAPPSLGTGADNVSDEMWEHGYTHTRERITESKISYLIDGINSRYLSGLYVELNELNLIFNQDGRFCDELKKQIAEVHAAIDLVKKGEPLHLAITLGARMEKESGPLKDLEWRRFEWAFGEIMQPAWPNTPRAVARHEAKKQIQEVN